MDPRTLAVMLMPLSMLSLPCGCTEGGVEPRGARAPGEVEAVAKGGGSLRWGRETGLEVRGWPADERFVAEVDGRLAGLRLPAMRLVEPKPTALSRVNRLAVVEAVSNLVAAEVEVLPSLGARVPDSEREGVVVIRGQVLGEGELRAMKDALAKARGVRVVTDLRVADPLVGSRLGLLHVGGRRVPGVGGELALASVVKRADGQTVATDGVGRIEPGRYQLADGTFARVHSGHRTEVDPDGPVILFEGRRYRLGHGIERVVGPGDEGALAVGDGVPRAVGDALERSVARLVIGADFAASSAEGHRRLVRRGTPAHFLIDFDGTVFQTLDLARVAPGMPGDEIHIALNNLLEPGGSGYPEWHERRAEMAMHEREGPELLSLGGRFTSLHGYTFAQRRALGVLTRRLVELFPRLGAGFVWAEGERGPFVLAERVESGRDGIMLASQLDPGRIDPGPGFQVRELAGDLAMHDEPIGWDVTGLAAAREILGRLFGREAREVLWADGRAELIRLRGLGCSGIFSSGFHVPWEDREEVFDHEAGVMLAATRARLGPTKEGGHEVLRVWRTTTRALRDGEVEGFPGGFERVAGMLDAGSEWYGWQVGDPKRPEEAVVGHGLVRTDGQWCLVVRPWAGLGSAVERAE